MVIGGGDDHCLTEWPWFTMTVGDGAAGWPDDAPVPDIAVGVGCGAWVAAAGAAVGSSGWGAVGLGMKPQPAKIRVATIPVIRVVISLVGIFILRRNNPVGATLVVALFQA